MLPFKLIYSDDYFLPIGEHVFRADKYRLIRECLLREGLADENDFVAPQAATESDLLLAHTPDYIRKLMEGILSAREELQLEIPYSQQAMRAFMLHTGGSILAAGRALTDGMCINLGGGFHHAFAEHGEGFCMINDIAVAIRAMQQRRAIGPAMTVDCDVHQGNGTAAIFGSAAVRPDPLPSSSVAGPAKAKSRAANNDVFTISLHQENNYPFTKPASSIDVNLPDGCDDFKYVGWLDNVLSSALRQFQPQLICYVAGADPYRDDQLGGLNLTMEGLKQRDELVFRAARAHGIPVMVTLAGGYARRVEDTVAIHSNTVIAAAEVWRATVSG